MSRIGNYFQGIVKGFGFGPEPPPLRKGLITASSIGDVVSRANDLPQDWLTATYAPGWPIQPITRPQEVEVPREIDYPIAINASLQPRTGYGLMPFSALRDAYENVFEVRNIPNTLLREMLDFKPHLIDHDDNELPDHPYSWICESPDRINSWDVWLARFIKSYMIYDAPVLYRQMGSDGNLEGLHYIDGSTIFIIIDDKGRVPDPNDFSDDPKVNERYQNMLLEWARRHPGQPVPTKVPAFAQVIKGTPFGWYSKDELWYKPRNRRIDSPYGESFIEMAWAWVLICANLTSFELAHYREGNVPEGLYEMPENWSLERIALWEQAFNARQTSSATERMRGRAVPAGTKWTETKKPDFPEILYTTAKDNIGLAAGMPPSETGKIPGQGLGGKGFGEMTQSALFRNFLIPNKTFIEGAFNENFDRIGVDAKLELALPLEDVDPEKTKDSVVKLFAAGVYSLNDALAEIGDEQVPGGDIRIVISGGQVIVLDDYLKQRVEGQTQPAGAAPVPAEAAQQVAPDGQTPTDLAVAEKILRERAISTKMISIPPVSDLVKHVAPATVLTGAVTNSQAQIVATKLGLDFDPAMLEQFRMGLEEEQEHSSVTGGDALLTARIVLDHLREDPQYYTHLAEAMEKRYKVERVGDKWRIRNIDKDELLPYEHDTEEGAQRQVRALYQNVPDVNKLAWAEFKKHCGMCDEDDDYFNAPIVLGNTVFSFPRDHHVNEVDIVTMKPEGLTPRPAIWKPEGGEHELLRAAVGGPLYPREEAAYLIDRSLGFYLVPVTYISKLPTENGETLEEGAVVHYVGDAAPARPVQSYAPEWVERAAVEDYIMSQQDRNTGNWLTHPDDASRPVLIDNGYAFPNDPSIYCHSPFCSAMLNKPFQEDTLKHIKMLLGDTATWKDVQSLIGEQAAAKAYACAARLVQEGMITAQTEHHTPAVDETTTATGGG